MAMPAFSARHSAGLSVSARAIALALVTMSFAGAVLIVLLRRMMGTPAVLIISIHTSWIGRDQGTHRVEISPPTRVVD